TTNGRRVRFTDRFCRSSTSSKSLAVVPSSTRPVRVTAPVCDSSASASVVFPLPEWPTSTTLRMLAAPPPAPEPLPPPAAPAPPEPDVPVTLVASSRFLALDELPCSQSEPVGRVTTRPPEGRSEEHTSELQSLRHL